MSGSRPFTVVIVGRPNVGKSTLFNRIVQDRISIVDPTPGVTRDRVSVELDVQGTIFRLVDTGGIGNDDAAGLTDEIESQISFAVEEADLILFLVDVRAGILAADKQIANRLRAAGKPMFLLANKAETVELEQEVVDFYELGLDDPMPISAMEGIGIFQLVDRILDAIPEDRARPGEEEERKMRLAFLGKRNVGKSTFVNALCKEERVIVSDVPGTTRDAVDVEVQVGHRTFIAVDTAGLRRRGKLDDAVEFYSQVRTRKALAESDVVLFLIDATEEVSRVDKAIGSEIVEAAKPCVLVLNKWDLIPPDVTPEEFGEYIRDQLPGLDHAPIICMSAKEGGRMMFAAIDLAFDLWHQAQVRAGTGELNRVVSEALALNRPRVKRGTVPKIYYATQVDIEPPTIILFCNKPSLFDQNYRRYLVNRLREAFDFAEVPLRLRFRERKNIFEEFKPHAGGKPRKKKN